MKKIPRLVFWIGGVLITLPVMGILFTNLYLQSEGVQLRINAAVAQFIDAPVKIKGSSFTPWGGLSIKGISVGNPVPGRKHNIATVEGVSVDVSWHRLFWGEIEISEITLVKPRLIVQREKDGNWDAFSHIKLPTSPSTDIAAIEPPTVEEVPAAVEPPASATTDMPAALRPPPSVKIILSSVRVRDAGVYFFDEKNAQLLQATGISVRLFFEPDGSGKGIQQAKEIVLSNKIYLRDEETAFTWKDGRVTVPEIRGLVGSGKFKASILVDFSGEQPSFRATSTLEKAKMVEMTQEIFGYSEGADGFLDIQSEISGDPTNFDTYTGFATAEIHDAKIRPLDILVQAGNLLGIDEFKMLQLSESVIQATIGEGLVRIEKATLRSQNLIIDGTGTISFDGKLDITAGLAISPIIQRQLKMLLSKHFLDVNEPPNYKRLDFKVGNTLDKPSTDLADKLTGLKDTGSTLENIEEKARGFINDIFGIGGKKKHAPTPAHAPVKKKEVKP